MIKLVVKEEAREFSLKRVHNEDVARESNISSELSEVRIKFRSFGLLINDH